LVKRSIGPGGAATTTHDHTLLRDAGPWDPLIREGALGGVRVVDLGQYIAGPLVATLLADQGADVVRVEPPGGPYWKSPANAFVLRRRRTCSLDLRDRRDLGLAREILSSADVAIENFRPGVAERLGVGPGWCSAHAPRLVYCSLPGFGATDPRAQMRAWEGVVMAAAGAYSLDVSGSLIPSGEGAAGGAVFSPLPLASVFAAAEGAMAVTAALIGRDRDGTGQWIEVPLFDSLFEAIGLRGLSFERGAKGFGDFGSGFYHCADGGFLTFIAVWFRHLEWFVDAAGLDSWVDDGIVDADRLLADPTTLQELRRRLAVLFATRPAEDWERIARDAGCTVGMLRSAREWARTEQASLSGTLIDVDDPELGRVRLPGRAVVVHSRAGTPASRPARATGPVTPGGAVSQRGKPDSPLLDGVRVLDLSRVVAAPTSAKLLGQLGADVIKIDEDPAEVVTAFEMPAFHEHLNRGKLTLILNLKDRDDAARFRELVRGSDVIIHNFGPGAESRLGIDVLHLWEISPRVVVVHLSTYGRSGPWAAHRGFAEIANITTGVTERSIAGKVPPTGSSASMDFPRWTFTDYAAGVVGAYGALLGLRERERSGEGNLVETSLARATSLEQLMYMVHPVSAESCIAETWRAESEPRGTDSKGWGPLQRLYDTSDGTIFVGAGSEQADAVYEALGIPSGMHDRTAQAASLQARLSNLTSQQAATALERAGAGVHRITSVAELMEPGGAAQLRGLRLEDSTEEFGKVVMPGPVVRFSRTAMRSGRFPTRFGSDAEAIEERLARSSR